MFEAGFKKKRLMYETWGNQPLVSTQTQSLEKGQQTIP